MNLGFVKNGTGKMAHSRLTAERGKKKTHDQCEAPQVRSFANDRAPAYCC